VSNAPLHWVDWVIVVVLCLSTLVSLWRGFAREAISLAGWVAAFVVANLFVDQVASLLSGMVSNVTGRYVLGYAILFVATLMVAGLVSLLAASLMRAAGLSVLDRIMGTVFGFVRGIIVVLVVVFLIRQLIPPGDLQWLQQSQLMPHLDMLAEWARARFAEIDAGRWV